MPDPDRVQPIVQESAANGGGAESDPDFLNKPINPQQDALESAGVYVQEPGQPRDSAVLIRRQDGKLLLRDADVPAGVTLAAVAGAEALRFVLTIDGGLVYDNAGEAIAYT